MEKLKKYGKKSLLLVIFIATYSILLTLLNYYNIITTNTIVKLNFIVITLITFIYSVLNGRFLEKNGYIEGLKRGGIIILVLFILNILFIRKISLLVFIYYLIILFSSTIGSMIGINLKKK